jgi:hypothetical protein
MRFYDVSVNRSVPTEVKRGLTSYMRLGSLLDIRLCMHWLLWSRVDSHQS